MNALDRAAVRAVAFIAGYTAFVLLAGILIGLFVRAALAQERPFPRGAICVADRDGDPPRNRAGERGYGHGADHDWLKGTRNPTTGTSCCNGLNEADGDCRWTRAWPGPDGELRALLDGAVVRVPESAIMPDAANRDPMRAIICGIGQTVFCFFRGGAGI